MMKKQKRSRAAICNEIERLMRRSVQLGTLLDDANPDPLVVAEMRKVYAQLDDVLRRAKMTRKPASR
jgi:hypothetical protein